MSPPVAVDLFCGAGGASLGVTNARYDLRLAADISPPAVSPIPLTCQDSSSSPTSAKFDADKVLTAAGLPQES
jgi:site-specific DNA-cytosine methylase